MTHHDAAAKEQRSKRDWNSNNLSKYIRAARQHWTQLLEFYHSADADSVV